MGDPQDGFEVVLTVESTAPIDYFVGEWFVDGVWYSGVNSLFSAPEQFSLTYEAVDTTLPESLTGDFLIKFSNGVWWLMANYNIYQGGTDDSRLWWSDDLQQSWNEVVIEQPESSPRVNTTDNGYPVTLMTWPSYDASSGQWWFLITTRRGFFTRILDPVRIATTDSLASGDWTLHDSITALPDIVADVPRNTTTSDWSVGVGFINPAFWATGMNEGKCYVFYEVDWFKYENHNAPYDDLHYGRDFILATADNPAGDWTLTPLTRYENYYHEGDENPTDLYSNASGIADGIELNNYSFYLAAGESKWVLADQAQQHLLGSDDALGESWEEIALPGIASGRAIYGDGTWVVFQGNDAESFVFAGDTPFTLERVEFDAPNAYISFQSNWVGYGYEYLDETYEDYRDIWLTPQEGGGWGISLA